MFINCTLKRSPELSHTQGLIDISMEIMRRNQVEVRCIRAVDHQIATGIWPDMTEHGWEADEWPAISQRVMAADILVLGMSIWLGEKSSIATRSSSACTRTRTCSTSAGSTPTTGGLVAAW